MVGCMRKKITNVYESTIIVHTLILNNSLIFKILSNSKWSAMPYIDPVSPKILSYQDNFYADYPQETSFSENFKSLKGNSTYPHPIRHIEML